MRLREETQLSFHASSAAWINVWVCEREKIGGRQRGAKCTTPFRKLLLPALTGMEQAHDELGEIRQWKEVELPDAADLQWCRIVHGWPLLFQESCITTLSASESLLMLEG